MAIDVETMGDLNAYGREWAKRRAFICACGGAQAYSCAQAILDASAKEGWVKRFSANEAYDRHQLARRGGVPGLGGEVVRRSDDARVRTARAGTRAKTALLLFFAFSRIFFL